MTKQPGCDNVKTIRHEMRTDEIWAAYLPFMDSTPPVLPDPSKKTVCRLSRAGCGG